MPVEVGEEPYDLAAHSQIVVKMQVFHFLSIRDRILFWGKNNTRCIRCTTGSRAGPAAVDVGCAHGCGGCFCTRPLALMDGRGPGRCACLSAGQAVWEEGGSVLRFASTETLVRDGEDVVCCLGCLSPASPAHGSAAGVAAPGHRCCRTRWPSPRDVGSVPERSTSVSQVLLRTFLLNKGS